MTELKTKPNNKNVEEFLKQVENPIKRKDSFKILELMREVTNEQPVMWGESIVGFGQYHYIYPSGREGDWFLIGFSPRKQSLTLYIMSGFDNYEEKLKNLGKYRTGKSCLYINKLEDVDISILKEIMADSIDYVKRTNQ